jgi:hypothetical protein
MDGYGANEDAALEKEATGGQTKRTTLTISKETGASRGEKGGPPVPELGRQHACCEKETPMKQAGGDLRRS